MRKDEDHDVVLVLERQADDLGAGSRFEVAASQSFALQEIDADLTLRVVPGSVEVSGECVRVELGLPLGLEVQDVDQDETGLGIDAICKPKLDPLNTASS